MVSHMVAELRIARRPKSRKRTEGDDLIRASTTLLESPAGDMAGARAINTLTCWLSLGLTAKLAKACAVPCEKPMYDNDFSSVVSRMYAILSGMSWKANSSMEKFQKAVEAGEWLILFFEYLLPRLFPSCHIYLWLDPQAGNWGGRSRSGSKQNSPRHRSLDPPARTRAIGLCPSGRPRPHCS